MTSKSDAELRVEYADTLEETPDAGTLRALRILDAGYREVAPPEGDADLLKGKLWLLPQPRRRRRAGRGAVVAAGLVLVAVMAGVAYALTSAVDLGKPENVQSPNAYFPLSGFHRSKVALPAGRRAELLFLGTQLPVDGGSALMRWPVIKALQQFGTLSNVQPVRPSCTPAQIVPENGCPFFPTFDWSHASYSSKYVTFVHKDLLNKVGARYQRMAPIEEKLYRAYARSSNRLPNDPDRVRASASFFGATATTRHLPLIAVDRYVETQSQVIVVGDFQLTVPITPATPTGFSERTQNYTWDQLHQALVTGKDPGTGSHTVEDVNAEANIITALICKADGGKPGSVCGRPAIGAILRHIR